MAEFLKKLQQSPEPVKRRWIFGLSAVATLVIVFIWLNFMSGIAPITSGNDVAVAPVQPAGSSFFDTMRAGITAIGGVARSVLASLGEIVKSLGSAIKTPKSYLIKP